MSRPLRWTICAAAALVVCCAGGLALGGGFLVNSGSAAQAASCGGPAPATPATGDLPSVDGLSADQMRNAATIIAVGQQMNVPPRGWVIAVATALQESDLINTPGGDQDSVGLFQQRPSQGWGTPAQLMDPAYASRKFYEKLLTINGWESMALTDAAQAVQHSAYPDAYAKHEPLATAIVNNVGSGNWRAIPEDLEQCPVNCPGGVDIGGQSSPDTGCLNGVVVLARAATWLTAWGGGPVPYLSSGDPATWFGGYRRDCSGYASMALGLAGPGLDGDTLAERSMPIPKIALRAGDLLINARPGSAGHVVIFDRWVDAAMTSYVGFEQSGDGGTHHRVIPYPYFGGYPVGPYRFAN